MMRNIGLKYSTWFLFAMFPFIAFGQWESGQVSVFFSLPEVALVDIEPGGDNRIQFTILPGTESGSAPTVENSSDNSLWLNYSSALPSSQNSRSITAEVSQGGVPKGIKLFLTASEFSGSGDGQRGSSAGRIELSNQQRPIISGIGNCYTGDGTGSGHQLTFSLEISDYTEIETAGENNFIVLYTLTDN
jgi:hypothetical protein